MMLNQIMHNKCYQENHTKWCIMLLRKSNQMMHYFIKEPNLKQIWVDDFLLKRSLGCLDIILKTPLFNPWSILRNDPWNLPPFYPTVSVVRRLMFQSCIILYIIRKELLCWWNFKKRWIPKNAWILRYWVKCGAFISLQFEKPKNYYLQNLQYIDGKFYAD